MRQITVSAPRGTAEQVAQVAFGVGIEEVTVVQRRALAADGSESLRDSIEMDVGTHVAKAFIDKFTSQPFFSRDKYSIDIRQPRSIVSRDRLKTLLRPLVEPPFDLFEELWQFSQITYGFVGRILIGAMLLAYGLANYQLLLIIAGLLFIPLLPLMLSLGFGLWTQQWRLVAQGAWSLVLAMILLTAGGIIVGLMSNGPVQYAEFNSLGTGLLISCAVGVAAGLATVDDVGRREMIGLAATAQVAIIPAWLGLCLVLGLPISNDGATVSRRLLALGLNIVAIIITSLITYAAMGVKGSALKCFRTEQKEG